MTRRGLTAQYWSFRPTSRMTNISKLAKKYSNYSVLASYRSLPTWSSMKLLCRHLSLIAWLNFLRESRAHFPDYDAEIQRRGTEKQSMPSRMAMSLADAKLKARVWSLPTISKLTEERRISARSLISRWPPRPLLAATRYIMLTVRRACRLLMPSVPFPIARPWYWNNSVLNTAVIRFVVNGVILSLFFIREAAWREGRRRHAVMAMKATVSRIAARESRDRWWAKSSEASMIDHW